MAFIMSEIKKIRNNSTENTWELGPFVAAPEEIIECLFLDVQALKTNIDQYNQFIADVSAENVTILDGENIEYSPGPGLDFFFYGTKEVQVANERIEVRTANCVKGRRLHARYISFTTASDQTFDNTGINNQDFGDVTYKMYKWVEGSRVETTTDAEAEETWIIFAPPFSYEICGGDVDVPAELPVDQPEDLDLWELHVAGNMTLEIATGGAVARTDLIANPRAKFKKGKNVGVDSTLNPAEMPYNDPAQNYPLTGGLPYPTNEIVLVVKHPAGKQGEFQLHLQLYK
jgi:hypothetical protein